MSSSTSCFSFISTTTFYINCYANFIVYTLYCDNSDGQYSVQTLIPLDNIVSPNSLSTLTFYGISWCLNYFRL